MKRIVECVPNFSGPHGLIEPAIAATTGIAVLDRTYDRDHNRSVITFAGPPERIADGALAAARRALETIDLRAHTGVHPRIGAIDVVPFVPVAGVTLEECAAIAVSVAERIWSELRIPVYLYEAAARRPACTNLADVRRNAGSLSPDIGGPAHHPSAGAAVVGARDFLIAFNVNLERADVEAARAIARKVRESSGGLPRVKALGLLLASEGTAQVSMNLTGFRTTGIQAAFDAVAREASALGIAIRESELIGLAPAAALDEGIARRVRLRGWDPSMILENRLAAALGTMEA